MIGADDETFTCQPMSDRNEDGLVSEPVHNTVEPIVGGLSEDAEGIVHTVNCQVVVGILGL